MILNERDARHEHILQVARQMMTAARTAPKGKGIDIIEVALITDEEIKQLSDTMIAMVEEHGMKFFLRESCLCCVQFVGCFFRFFDVGLQFWRFPFLVGKLQA